jgi:hypothetical protein
MSEPFLERLSQLTPSAGALDRDALLFAAGRSSARPNRGWMTLATFLASTQALSLVLLLSHQTRPAADRSLQVATLPESRTMIEPQTSAVRANRGQLTDRHSLWQSVTEVPPSRDATFVDTGPPLRAFGAIPPSLLN